MAYFFKFCTVHHFYPICWDIFNIKKGGDYLKKINLQIPTGYEILEKNHTLKTHKALDLLLSGKQSEYSKAIKNDNGTITLFYPVIKCPYCSGELPIKHSSNKTLRRDEIVQWGLGQLSLLEQEKTELVINDKFSVDETIYCPCCRKESEKTENHYSVSISKKRRKIKVLCMFNSIEELLNTEWTEEVEIKSPFVYYETVVFNLKNGHTHIQITDQEGNSICTRDITQTPDCIKNGLIYNLLLTNQQMRKEIKKFFKDGSVFIFHSKEITFEKLVMATRFVGYNRSFYNAVPYNIGTYKLFHGFKSIAKGLHIAKKIPILYKRLKLPTNKATRRIVLSNPGLIFYYREIGRLYCAINNIDYFNKILSFEHIYFILAKINCYPVICEFIREAFKYENSSVVINQIENNFYNLSEYAIRYMSMKDAVKRMERKRKKWLQLCSEYAYGEEASVLPSVVRFVPCEEMADCEIDGYRFEWLVTSNDYEKAGRKMHNCLISTYQPVIVIKSNGIYIAAIALDISNYKKITQAFMCHNRPVRDSVPLCLAIRKWCNRYNVEWDDYENYNF